MVTEVKTRYECGERLCVVDQMVCGGVGVLHWWEGDNRNWRMSLIRMHEIVKEQDQ